MLNTTAGDARDARPGLRFGWYQPRLMLMMLALGGVWVGDSKGGNCQS